METRWRSENDVSKDDETDGMINVHAANRCAYRLYKYSLLM